MRRGRRLIVGLLLLWLPLQAIAAVSMPFCAHGAAGVASETTAQAHGYHRDTAPAHGQHDGQHGAQHSPPGTLGHCNDCGACNLACAPAVPASIVLLAQPALSDPPQFSTHFAGLFIPDQPQPPPNPRV